MSSINLASEIDIPSVKQDAFTAEIYAYLAFSRALPQLFTVSNRVKKIIIWNNEENADFN